RILVVGSEPEIYFYADRPACTRLVITYPLTGPYPYGEGLRREFLNDCETCRPRYAIFCRDPASICELRYRQLADRFIGPVGRVLQRDYVEEASFPMGVHGVGGRPPQYFYTVLRRKDA